jgi:steroid 5-alpha reductase family enzyme
MELLVGGALGLASLAMAALWMWQRRAHNATAADAAWPLLVGGLAVFYAVSGGGASARRSAIAWMMGSWGARLGVYLFWDRVFGRPEDPRYQSMRSRWAERADVRFFWLFQRRAVAAVFFSLPALFASVNPEPVITTLELVAAATWIVGFAGETTADRQLLRFRSDPANRGRTCTTGLWGSSRHPNYFFEWLMWVGFGLFAAASPRGWIAISCPAVMLQLLLNVTGIPRVEAQSIRSRGDEYRQYQLTTSAFVPWFRTQKGKTHGTRRAQLRRLCTWILNPSAGPTPLRGANRSLNGPSSGS